MPILGANLQRAEDGLTLAEIAAVFDAHNNCTDNFATALAFGSILTPNLCPEDTGSVENFEILSLIYLDFVRYVGTFDDGGMVFVT